MLLDLNERFCASDGIGTKSSRTRNLRTHIASPLKALLASKMSSRRFSNFAISEVDDAFDDFADGTSEEPPAGTPEEATEEEFALLSEPIDLNIFANNRALVVSWVLLSGGRSVKRTEFSNPLSLYKTLNKKYLFFFCRPKREVRTYEVFLCRNREEKGLKSATTKERDDEPT